MIKHLRGAVPVIPLIIVAAILAVVPLTVNQLQQQTQTESEAASIRVYALVKSINGSTIQGALVSLDNGYSGTCITDGIGTCSIGVSSNRTINVTAARSGYASRSTTISVGTTNAGVTLTLPPLLPQPVLQPPAASKPSPTPGKNASLIKPSATPTPGRHAVEVRPTATPTPRPDRFTLSGKITDFQTKTPIADVTISLFKGIPLFSSVYRGGTATRSDGTYSFPANTLEFGNYYILLQKSGYTQTRVGFLLDESESVNVEFIRSSTIDTATPTPTIPISQCANNSCVTSASNKQVDGSIYLPNGQRYTGSGYTITLHNDRTGTEARRNPTNGTYVIDRLSGATDPYTISATPPSGYIISGPLSFTLGSGQRVTHNFYLRSLETIPTVSLATPTPKIVSSTASQPKRITGSIFLPNGQLFTGTGYTITLRNTRTGATAKADPASGVYTFDSLSSATDPYTLSASAPLGYTISEPLVLDSFGPGQVITHNFYLTSASSLLTKAPLPTITSKPAATPTTSLQAPTIAPIGSGNNTAIIEQVDFQTILDCYSTFQPARNCNDTKKGQADLNKDGNVNYLDINLFVRN